MNDLSNVCLKILAVKIVECFCSGLKREHSSVAEMEETQFYDADGPFWEDDVSKWTKTGDVHRKLKKPVAVLARAPIGKL